MTHDLEKVRFKAFASLKSIECVDIALEDFDFIIKPHPNALYESDHSIFDTLRKPGDENRKTKIETEEIPCILISGLTKSDFIDEKTVLEDHTGFAGISIDSIENPELLGTEERYQELKEKLRKDQYTFRLYRSPRGQDIRIIVKIPPETWNHEDYYLGLIDHYKSEHSVVVEEKHKAINQRWLYSYDPGEDGLYKNDKATIFGSKRIVSLWSVVNKKLSSPEIEAMLTKIENSENLFWKNILMKDVIAHFKILTVSKSKNGKEFLSEEGLISFLKRAFLGEANLQKQIINYGSKEKGMVVRLFFDFYWDIGVVKYLDKQNKERYINLLIDNFDGWEYKRTSYLFKPRKVKARFENAQ